MARPLHPVMDSTPEHAPAAIDNMLADGLITPRQARMFRLLASRGQPMRVAHAAPRHTAHVTVGADALRVTPEGFVRY